MYGWSSWGRTKVRKIIWPEKLPLGLQRSVIINQPEKKRTKLHFINKGQTLIYTGLKKGLDQNCQFLNKYQESLIEKLYGKHRIDQWQQHPLNIPPRRWRTLYYTYILTYLQHLFTHNINSKLRACGVVCKNYK